MTLATRASGPETGARPITTSWLALVLVAASVFELLILRIGTRTAIHIPGIEEVAGPYRTVAAAGRLAFFVAVVMLAMLLVRVAHDLYRDGQTHAAVALFMFVVVAGLGGLRVVGNDVLAPTVTAIITSLSVAVLARQRLAVKVVVGLLVVAFLTSALHALPQGGFGGDLPRLAELLAVTAAISSGPLVRRGLGDAWFPVGRLAWASGIVGLVVTSAIIASPSTVHILMLWNFGLTGGLPAIAYGLAAASAVVAVGSSVRRGQPLLALALTLVFLGGVGLASTYRSGLVVAGLGLLGLTEASQPDAGSPPPEPALSRSPGR
jgi:hypothetical protein